MTGASTLRVAAVVVAGAGVEQRARALSGFLRRGLRLPPETALDAATHLFCGADDHLDRLVALAPTRDVRAARTAQHRPDLAITALTDFQRNDGADLYIFPDGPLGAELATRFATRTQGSVLSGVLDAEFADGCLHCRRAAYSGHLSATFALGPRPWCVVLDAGWSDDAEAPIPDHIVRAERCITDTGASVPAGLRDIEELAPTPTGDLETARFLVVVGRGVGSRDGVQRVADAAARMGAALGVTRPVVMNAWAASDRQIGVSAARTAPAVCIVAGSSGAPALLCGIERAAFIVAIDTDEHAAIIGAADAAVIDDAVAVLEALADLLDQR